MINPVSWHPDSGIVAIFTDVTGQNMSRVLAGRVRTVMAARAIAGDIDVIKVRRHPAIGGMTVVTAVAARNVGRVLAGCDTAVVAGLTGADNLSVIHHSCRRPKIHAMAVLANGGCCYVVLILAGGVGAVMAA